MTGSGRIVADFYATVSFDAAVELLKRFADARLAYAPHHIQSHCELTRQDDPPYARLVISAASVVQERADLRYRASEESLRVYKPDQSIAAYTDAGGEPLAAFAFGWGDVDEPKLRTLNLVQEVAEWDAQEMMRSFAELERLATVDVTVFKGRVLVRVRACSAMGEFVKALQAALRESRQKPRKPQYTQLAALKYSGNTAAYRTAYRAAVEELAKRIRRKEKLDAEDAKRKARVAISEGVRRALRTLNAKSRIASD